MRVKYLLMYSINLFTKPHCGAFVFIIFHLSGFPLEFTEYVIQQWRETEVLPNIKNVQLEHVHYLLGSG